MERITKIVLMFLFMFIVCCHSALAVGDRSHADRTVDFDWGPVIEAIIQVESNGNRHAVKGQSVGAMQIIPILVGECNRILKNRKSKKRFKLSDRFSIAKSKEMFLLIQSVYNPLNNVEKAIRSWNGGNNYTLKRTQHYFEKVSDAMK